MSELRKQLEAEKAQYRSARYPGDLAAELLGVSSRRRMVLKLFTAGVAVSGIAAAVLVWMASQPAANVSQPASPSKVTISKDTTPKPPALPAPVQSTSPAPLPSAIAQNNPAANIVAPVVAVVTPAATTQPDEDAPSITEMAAVSIESPLAASMTASMAASATASATTTAPTDTQFAPSFQSMEIGSMPAMPSMPSMDLTSTETESAKEST